MLLGSPHIGTPVLFFGKLLGPSSKVGKEVAVGLEKAGKVYQCRGENSSGAIISARCQNVSLPNNGSV